MTTVETNREKWTHAYDASGERVWSWRTWSATSGSPGTLPPSPGEAKETIALRGLDGKVLREYTTVGSETTWEDYYYREGQLWGSAKSAGGLRHFSVDHLGTVRLVTDSSGGLVSRHDYFPYGEEYPSSGGSDGEQMKFTGHERDLGVLGDSADDLDYMHARYYRPGWGRFLSVDSAPPKPGDPQSWNRYAYVSGNPVRFADPFGEVKFSSLEIQEAFAKAVEYLAASEAAKAVVTDVLNLRGAQEPTLVETEGLTYFIPSRNLVRWNSRLGNDVSGVDANGSPGADGSFTQSPALLLLHEPGRARCPVPDHIRCPRFAKAQPLC